MEAYLSDEIDVVSLKDLRSEEIEKYSINESFSEKEKTNYVIKRGFVIQKLAMINRIPYILKDKELTEFTFHLILDYIEIWDDTLQISFAKSISECFKSFSDVTYDTMKNLINLLLKFCMKIISTEAESISVHYVEALNSIVWFYDFEKKIKLEYDAIEYACAMGVFGKNTVSRRLSVYLCASLIRVSDTVNSELYNRFMILSYDSDRIIKLEVAHNLGFLAIAFSCDRHIKSNILKVFESYSTEDDTLILVENYKSYITNVSKIKSDNLIKLLISKFNLMLEENHNVFIKEFSFFYKIFKITIEGFKNIDSINRIYLLKYLSSFMKIYFHSKVSENLDEEFYFFIEKFNLIYDVFKNPNEIWIIKLLVKLIFFNFSFFANHFFQNFKFICDSFKREIFLNQVLVDKLSNIIQYNLEANNFQNFQILMRNIDLVMPYIENEVDLKNTFIFKFDTIYTFLVDKSNSYLEVILFLKTIRKSEILFLNNELLLKLQKLIIVLIELPAQNYQIVKNCFKVLPYILKYSFKKQKDEILKFIENEVVESKSFYFRRYFIDFLNSSCKINSVNFLIVNGIIDLGIRLITQNSILTSKLIKIIKIIFLHLPEDIKSNILSKIKLIKANRDDKLIKEEIKSFEYFKFENSENLEIFNLEKEKIEKEKQLQSREIVNKKVEKKVKKILLKKLSYKENKKKINDLILISNRDKEKKVLKDKNSNVFYNNSNPTNIPLNSSLLRSSSQIKLINNNAKPVDNLIKVNNSKFGHSRRNSLKTIAISNLIEKNIQPKMAENRSLDRNKMKKFNKK